MRRRFASIALAAGLTLGTVFTIGPAAAKQTEECSNRGGNQPSGQQGKCKGGGLTCLVVNPSGKPPPGQQPC